VNGDVLVILAGKVNLLYFLDMAARLAVRKCCAVTYKTTPRRKRNNVGFLVTNNPN
jgi:hypothetical protein